VTASPHRIRDSLIGTALRGRAGATFFVRELLGEGGQGWVFKANYDDPEGFWIVVKLLRPEGLNHETLERFERETRALRVLGTQASPSPNIVRLFDHGIHQLKLFGADLQLPFMALEYVNGPDLASVIDGSHGQGLAVARVTRIMHQVANGLATVHASGIIHRDLKPSNILLAEQEGREVAKITDFGLVKAPALSSKATATIAGATLGYAPPEQYELGNSRVSPRTDVFSFGAILFEMLTGRVAFPHVHGDSPLRTVARMLTGERPSLTRHPLTLSRELRGSPHALAAIDRELLRAMSAEPEARHESVAELWRSLDPLLRSIAGEEGGTVSVYSQAPATNPGLGFSPSMRVAPFPRERFRAGVYLPERDRYVALGMNGLFVAARGTWSPLKLSTPIDARAIRGVAARGPEHVAVFGDGGLLAFVDLRGNVVPVPLPDVDCNWFGAFTDDGDCILAGERRSRQVGVVAELGSSFHLHVVSGTRRLHAATRLSSGAILVCGGHGDLVQVSSASQREVPWGKTGHLFALTRNHYGGAFVVGSGGHALSVTMSTSLADDSGGLLSPVLEQVTTTKDLLAVKLSSRNTAWAVGHAARLMERRGGVWVRVPVEGVEENFVAVDEHDGLLLVLAEDGTLIEAALPPL
jgi:eukaryotic-like serine/threonine-protein kinase